MGSRAAVVGICLVLAGGLLPGLGCSESATQEESDPESSVDATNPTKKNDAGSKSTKPTETQPEGYASAPTVTAVTPDGAEVGSVGPEVVVSGTNFVERSIVQLNGSPLATTYVSPTELRATIPTSELATLGTLLISVGTSPPGGGASSEVTFEVRNPLPTLTAIAPLSALSGSGATKLTLTGTRFVSGTTVRVGSTTLAPTTLSSTTIDVSLTPSLLATSGTLAVAAINPGPGGGASNAIAFTVVNPDVVISSVSPQTAIVGSGAVSITVDGVGFLPASTVLFNGTTLSSSYVNATRLTASIPANLLTNVADYPITVGSPPPGGGVSAPVTFRVQYPVPSISDVSPNGVDAYGGAVDVIVSGAGFTSSSQISFDNAPATTNQIDATHLKATLPASLAEGAKVIQVRVMNPAPGGGTSSALAITVSNPSPAISNMSPGSVPTNSADTTVTLTGTGFVPTSQVKANGSDLATTFTSSTQLKALFPASKLASPGSLVVTVANGAPGGGTSPNAIFTVGCDGSGVDISLVPGGPQTTMQTLFSSATLTEPRISTAKVCPVSLSTTSVQPSRYWVVQNVGTVAATLSVWGVCTKTTSAQSDAFVALYKGGTKPATDNDRKACTGTASEGGSTYFSPEANGSNYCPGLTKANGGGLVLGACEKAVIHAQPYSMTSTSFPPPTQLRARLE